MKRTVIHAIGILLLSISLSSFVMVNEAEAQPGSAVSLQLFYDDLAPYGQWISDDQYGYVWVPDVEDDFRPYTTNGYWVMTEFGNTWVSAYPWDGRHSTMAAGCMTAITGGYGYLAMSGGQPGYAGGMEEVITDGLHWGRGLRLRLRSAVIIAPKTGGFLYPTGNCIIVTLIAGTIPPSSTTQPSS